MGDLSGDELVSSEDGLLKEFDLSEKEANDIIMAARAHWFEDELPTQEKGNDPDTDEEKEKPIV